MGNFLRQVGFALVVLVLTAIIFVLVVKDKQAKQSVIENSLGLLGERLIKMVPEGAQKQSVKDQFDGFLRRVTNHEVKPAQVEHVAATILNFSNHDSILTPEAASALLSSEIFDPMPQPDTIKILIPPPPTAAPEDWDQLGQRIQRLCELNENIREEFRHNAELKREFRRQMQFRTQDGLKLVVDVKMQERLHHADLKRLQRNLEQMEREKIIIWRKNFAVERDSLRGELEELQELRELHLVENLAHLSELKARENLEALVALDSLEGDSIRIIVNESLRDAERVPDEEKK